jgi:hypothetical protein
MESTSVYWIPVYQILESRGLEGCLVNAPHVKKGFADKPHNWDFDSSPYRTDDVPGESVFRYRPLRWE